MTDSPTPLVGPLNRKQVSRRAEDLRGRVALVRGYGWAQYRNRCSKGEALSAALALNNQAELRRHNEPTEAALSAWAHTPWGITRGQSDTADELPSTRAWLDALQDQPTAARTPG